MVGDETRSSVRWLASVLGIWVETLLVVRANAGSFYRPFPMKRGTKIRQIDRPMGVLRLIQDRIKEHLLAIFPFPEPLHGCVRGRSPLTNARQHLNQPCVAKLDLRNFYPSVTCRMVYEVWRTVFGFGQPIACLLTQLTTHCGHLPQGAPTSGYLANLVLLPAVARIKALAASMGCSVTFYVDDIAVSGSRAREVLGPLIDILHECGLSIRHGKTKVMGRNVAQMLTGLNVNGLAPTVPRPKRDRVAELIHEARLRRGYGENVTVLEKSIRGRITHIRRTNPGHAERLEKLLVRR